MCVSICISCQFDCSCVVVFKCKLTVSYIGFLNDTVVDWVMYVFCSLENSFTSQKILLLRVLCLLSQEQWALKNVQIPCSSFRNKIEKPKENDLINLNVKLSH